MAEKIIKVRVLHARNGVGWPGDIIHLGETRANQLIELKIVEKVKSANGKQGTKNDNSNKRRNS